MDHCGKLVAGGPCMRSPGHGGGCFSGHIVPVDTPEFTLPSYSRVVWRLIRNRETIRFALLAMLVIAQVWIDVVCIMLWK